jgi:hypothetical protein
MKRIIWSNTDLEIDDDWKAAYKEFLEINNMDVPLKIDDYDVEVYMCETNDMYLDDERMNLDKTLDGRILVIADLGLWDGRKQGYKILGKNLNNIFDINSRGFDYAEFYGDGYNIKAIEHHHDGTNYYEYRVIREDRDIDKLLNAIYNGEEVTRKKINYYTKSLYKDVAKIYGW